MLKSYIHANDFTPPPPPKKKKTKKIRVNRAKWPALIWPLFFAEDETKFGAFSKKTPFFSTTNFEKSNMAPYFFVKIAKGRGHIALLPSPKKIHTTYFDESQNFPPALNAFEHNRD